MENTISITTLNDFIFCPVSIYFHSIDNDTNTTLYHSSYQINGHASHEKVDKAEYSDRKDVLQAIPVYCEKYNLMGKIDVFDVSKGRLTERKRKINTIFDGYIYQVYAQYFSLIEMGYEVRELRLYSMIDNKVYPVKRPEDDPMMLSKFEKTIKDLNDFKLKGFKQENKSKCENCIYEPLCAYSIK